jgi:scyllo-inositol 2-dehydrogenase (NADP+)
MADVRVAVVGYGLAGRFFHAPLIAATSGLEVSFVVTSSDLRRRQLAQEHPQARAVAAIEDLWEEGPELLVVASPNDSHAELALAAISRGIPVVVDKPLALTVGEAEGLVDEAERRDVVLTVFQNRRWDTDQLTLRRLIAEGALGTITRYESRFERWRPESDAASWRDSNAADAGGGQLLDLGSHLVDQALTLFGPATHVYSEVEHRRRAPGDDDAFVALRHADGVVSHLWASAVAPAPGPRLRVQGTAAGFVVRGLDPQEDALRAGERPGEGWGMSEAYERGRIIAGERSVPVTPEPGDWPRFYALLRDALRHGGSPPVDARDAINVLRVLEAARRAGMDGRVIEMVR